ncbi:hypothetical protein CMI37_04205 [Candidatus Pacearchaeota archaeon]|jgi:hypothetical protein|nr:hypothetical protein [Candidatus Pacearchaeota archaeon]|tara:strand:- start:212 stop:685 length:474 start_codon:yes stop_codon:yes gene_type:complete
MATGLPQIYVTGLTDTSTTDLEGVGKLRFEDNKWYKWVKYDEGAGALDIVAGDVVYYDNAAGSGYVNSIVTADLSDSDEVGAGVVMATVTVTATFMWIQIKGVATLSTALTAGADGDALTATGTTDKTLDIADDDLDAVVGVAIDASAKIIYCDFPW